MKRTSRKKKEEKGMNWYVCLLVILLCFLLSGCGRVLNPYESEFLCPQMEQGKCVGISEAYKESLDQEKGIKEYNLAKEAFSSDVSEGKGKQVSYSRDSLLLSPAERQYIESLYDVLTKLLKDPQAPVIMPPKIVRVLILPYQNQEGKNLYSARYVYVIVEDPKWVLHNILTSEIAPEE